MNIYIFYIQLETLGNLERKEKHQKLGGGTV